MDKKNNQQRTMRSNSYNDDERLYLQMMQANIERMAANSANCKVWMISLITAFITIGSLFPNMRYWLLMGIIPILTFWYIDAYYLHLERGMRNRERDFFNIRESGSDNEYKRALFNFSPLSSYKDNAEKGFVATKGRLFSPSIAPFYCFPLVMVIILSIIFNWEFIEQIFHN